MSIAMLVYQAFLFGSLPCQDEYTEDDEEEAAATAATAAPRAAHAKVGRGCWNLN